jgi:hypothetical protein
MSRSSKVPKRSRPSQGGGGGSFEKRLISEGLKGISVAATAVADDEHGDGDSEDSSVEQHAVSSDSVICKDLSIAEVEISPFFFSEEHELKSDSIVPRLGSLSSGCILGTTLSFCYQDHESICVCHL